MFIFSTHVLFIVLIFCRFSPEKMKAWLIILSTWCWWGFRRYNCEILQARSPRCGCSSEICRTLPQLTLAKLNNEVWSEDVSHLIKRSNNESQAHSGIYFPNSTIGERIQLTCSATYPVEIDIISEMPVVVKDVEMKRIILEYPNKCYQYNISFYLSLAYNITGSYACQEISSFGNQSARASVIHLFVNDEGSPQLLNPKWKRQIETNGVPNDDGLIQLPCISTNPHMAPQLFKIINETNELAKANQDYEDYDPSRGFLVNARRHIIVNFYNCSMNGTSHRIQLLGLSQDTGKMPIRHHRVRPLNHGGLISAQINESVNLACESNQAIKFTWPANENPNLQFNVRQIVQPESFYTYKTTMSITGLVQSSFSIKCAANETGGTLREWNYGVLSGSLGSQLRTGIHFDGDQHFTCNSSNSQTPLIGFITCINPINCKTAKRFSHMVKTHKDYFPFKPTIIGYACYDTKTKIERCATIPVSIGSRDGIVLCEESSEHSDEASPTTHYKHYNSGFDRSIFTLINQKTIPKILRINQTDPIGPVLLFEEEPITFTCEASANIFAQGLQFYVYFNSTLRQRAGEHDSEVKIVETLSDGKITANMTIKLMSSSISRIECSAPLWNSNTWIVASKEIRIEEGECVSVLGPKIEHFSWNELEEKILICKAKGNPKPTIEWSKDDKNISTVSNAKPMYDTNEKANNYSTTSVLHFSQIKEYNEGKYTCVATSRKNIDYKEFIVTVKDSKGILFYGIIGLGVFCAVIIIIGSTAMYIVRKQKALVIEKLTELEIHEFVHGNQDLIQKYTDLHDNARYLPYKQDFEIPKHKLEIRNDELLGSGVTGFVFKGYLTRHEKIIPVAIKTVRGCDVSSLKILLSEIKILMYIGNHSNVISLFGAMTNDLREGKLHAVVEFCGNGSLQSFLREHRETYVDQIVNDEINLKVRGSRLKAISWKLDDFIESDEVTTDPNSPNYRRTSNNSLIVKTIDLVKWSIQLASGMEYLGKKKVIHGDLALRNVLLTEDLVIKITDFGLSRHLYDYTYYVKRQKEDLLPWRWLAVEAIGELRLSIETDIWSYAITLWEIYSLGEIPYQGCSWGQEFVQLLESGYRPPQPKYASSAIYNIMKDCWLVEPKARPSFASLIKSFQELLAKSNNN